MNRYPVWKYAIIAVALAFGLLYTLPNFFGEAPAVQVSSGKATVKIGEYSRGGCSRGDTKAADPKKNPMEKNLDNLLDKLE